jgi:protein-S-isoprenylcysteine O-methyltransferase Ste14
MLLGTALLEGIGVWGVIFLLALVMVEGRIRVEERLLTGAFGTEYASYRAAVPQLVPGLHVGRSH